MASAFFPSFISVIILLLMASPTFSIGTAKDEENLLPSSAFMKFLMKQAEKFIREVNLFPQDDININTLNDSAEASGAMVEKLLQLSILGDSGASVQDLAHHAGYFRLPHTKAARMFYFFFESRKNKADPVVLWLTGGPGCGGELGLFYENGPFKITDDLSLVWNDFGWDKISNLIYVDQPTGTGFSYSSSKDDIRHDQHGVSTDLYDFLQAFFKEHPEYAKNDFYITGESYAGHYIPALASRVHQGNQNKEGLFINLKGFAIGNGLTNPEIQFKAYPDYALDMKLISQSDYNSLMQSVVDCDQAIKPCGTDGHSSCVTAFQVCQTIFNDIISIASGINYYDIRKKCEGELCYDFSKMVNYLNQEPVKDALGVGNVEFVLVNMLVNQAMLVDYMRNFEVGIPALLEVGIKLLVYAGEYDLTCNWLGNLRWVGAMKWSGQNSFLAAPTIPFAVNDVEAGIQKKYGPLVFLKVNNAGHMVPMDQPQASLEMLQRWLQGNL